MPLPSRRLIVNADDFGRSHSINQAILSAHKQGILTTASLMVNGEAFEEALEMARANPKLGVGLHLALICGKSTLSPKAIPGLVNAQSEFSNDPVAAGFRYFFSSRLKSQLAAEIAAQVARFQETGLKLDHLNGHLHFHLHPAVFAILMENASAWRLNHVRLTRDPLLLNLKLARGRYFYRLSHALIFGLLSRRACSALRNRGIRSTSTVFGLLQNAQVDQPFVSKLIPRLPPGDSELYSHPSLDEFKNEFNCLIDPGIKALIVEHGVALIRYQDL